MISLCKGKHILSTSHIIPIWEHIRNIADINELSEIGCDGLLGVIRNEHEVKEYE